MASTVKTTFISGVLKNRVAMVRTLEDFISLEGYIEMFFIDNYRLVFSSNYKNSNRVRYDCIILEPRDLKRGRHTLFQLSFNRKKRKAEIKQYKYASAEQLGLVVAEKCEYIRNNYKNIPDDRRFLLAVSLAEKPCFPEEIVDNILIFENGIEINS